MSGFLDWRRLFAYGGKGETLLVALSNFLFEVKEIPLEGTYLSVNTIPTKSEPDAGNHPLFSTSQSPELAANIFGSFEPTEPADRHLFIFIPLLWRTDWMAK